MYDVVRALGCCKRGAKHIVRYKWRNSDSYSSMLGSNRPPIGLRRYHITLLLAIGLDACNYFIAFLFDVVW